MVETVSFLIPVYNEAAHIETCLDSIAMQDTTPESVEVVIADGDSTDGTLRKIEEFRIANPSLSVIVKRNPSRNTAVGRNICLASASGNLVLNFSGHAVSEPNLVRILRGKLLEQPQTVAAVGSGIRNLAAGSLTGKAISTIMSSPLGGGKSIDAGFNSDHDQFARSIAFALYRKSVVVAVGGFDEALWCGQDAELNYRLFRNGYRIMYTPETTVCHYKRSSIREFVRQMYRYGIARAMILKKYPDSFRIVHALPAAFCILLPVAVGASWFSDAMLWITAVSALLFLGISVIATLKTGGDWSVAAISPVLYGAMYIGYGAGVLWEYCSGWRRKGESAFG